MIALAAFVDGTWDFSGESGNLYEPLPGGGGGGTCSHDLLIFLDFIPCSRILYIGYYI